MRREYADPELRALILDWLVRRGKWSASYSPLDTLTNSLSNVVKNDGRRIKKAVDDLVKRGFLNLHKKGDTVSLNPRLNREILEFVKKIMACKRG